MAYEPPELVGSTTTSVAQAKPEIISQAAEVAKSFGLPLIIGAGIHSQEDIRKGLGLGAVGFAVATNVVKAQDPRSRLSWNLVGRISNENIILGRTIEVMS